MRRIAELKVEARKLRLILFTNLNFKHFINKDFNLKSYLLAIKDLKEKHFDLYLKDVLIQTLKDYNIKYNITKYLLFII